MVHPSPEGPIPTQKVGQGTEIQVVRQASSPPVWETNTGRPLFVGSSEPFESHRTVHDLCPRVLNSAVVISRGRYQCVFIILAGCGKSARVFQARETAVHSRSNSGELPPRQRFINVVNEGV